MALSSEMESLSAIEILQLTTKVFSYKMIDQQLLIATEKVGTNIKRFIKNYK